MSNKCRVCTNEIEAERLSILPNTVFCAPCAQKHNVVKPRKGIMIYGHKTAGEIQIMSEALYEKEKKYYEPLGARSSLKNFSRNICA